MEYRKVNKKSNIKSIAENHFFQRNLFVSPLNIVQISFVSYMNMRVPFLKRISVRCLKSSSFYFVGSNNSKGLTRKSKNSIKCGSDNGHTGGGFLAKFRVGVCRPQFQNGTVG